MDEMLALLGTHTPCLLFEQLFLEHLSEDICIQLVVDTMVESYCELAICADALWSSQDAQQTSFTTNALNHRLLTQKTRSSDPKKSSVLACASIIAPTEKQSKGVDSHVNGREMSRPAASSHSSWPE